MPQVFGTLMGEDTDALPLYLQTLSNCFNRRQHNEDTHTSKRGSIVAPPPLAAGAARLPIARLRATRLVSRSIMAGWKPGQS